jgi:hypothetical protein
MLRLSNLCSTTTAQRVPRGAAPGADPGYASRTPTWTGSRACPPEMPPPGGGAQCDLRPRDEVAPRHPEPRDTGPRAHENGDEGLSRLEVLPNLKLISTGWRKVTPGGSGDSSAASPVFGCFREPERSEWPCAGDRPAGSFRQHRPPRAVSLPGRFWPVVCPWLLWRLTP